MMTFLKKTPTHLLLCLSCMIAPSHGWSGANLWDQAHSLLLQGKEKKALKQVQKRSLKKGASVNRHSLNLLEARSLYQTGQYDLALKAYNRISKKSDLWLSSVEERAWAKIQLGQINGAIADTKTLLSPVFLDSVGPETFFLSSYVAHQVCDFATVFKITDTFKTKSKDRIVHLEKMARKEMTVGVSDFLKTLFAENLESALNPQTMAFFPRHFLKDKKLNVLFESVDKARLGQGITSGKGPVGPRTQKIQDTHRASIQQRLASLAEIELDHYKDVIKKLHLIEANAIQRLYLDKSLSGSRQTLAKKKSKRSHDLVFPFDEREVWVDEIDSLEVKAQTCPQAQAKQKANDQFSKTQDRRRGA